MAENKNVAGVKSPELVKYLDCGCEKKQKQMQMTNIINNCVNNQQNNLYMGSTKKNKHRI